MKRQVNAVRVFHEIRRPHDDNPLGLTASRNRTLTFMAHWHHDIELILAMGGEIPVGIGGKIHKMKQGDFAIVGRGEIHFYEGEQDACDIYILIFPPHLLGQGCWPVGHRFRTPFFTERPGSDPTCVSLVMPETMAILRKLFLDIIAEVPVRDPAHEDMLKGCVYLFCGTAARLLPTDAAIAAVEKRRLEQVMRIQQAMEWIGENYRSDVTLGELSRQMNTSYHYLSRLFGETVGTPFKQHLNLLRINEADRMLSGSTLSIMEIALHCGFNSLRTFNRVYRSIRGQAPSAGR